MNYLTNNNDIKNYKMNNKFSQTIKTETPSLSLLRSTDYTKRDFRFQININKKKLNNTIGFKSFSNTINAVLSVEENLTQRQLNNNSKNIHNNAFKILKIFNKIKDITIKLEIYYKLINFLFNLPF